MKWKKLKGHEAPVTCIAVEEQGNYLASFSMRDRNLKIWKVKTSLLHFNAFIDWFNWLL